MENKLDILTKKLYDEGIDKARQDADGILAKAREEADRIVAAAESKAREIVANGELEVENLKKKAESEMTLSARQAVTALKQAITNLISGTVASEIAGKGFEDREFIEQLLVEIVKKWDVSAGSLNLELLLSAGEKKQFEAFVAKKYKELLDKGLEIKVGSMKEGFLIQPKDGGYQIAFSEELFEAFFDQYLKGFTKSLLYK